MKLRRLGIVVLGAMLMQGTILGAEDKSYQLSEAIQKIIAGEKPIASDASKMTFPDMEFYLNGKKIELNAPIMSVNGKTFLPVRALGNALEISVSYAPQHKVAYIDTATVKLELPLNYSKAVKNGSEVLVIEGAKVELYKGSAYLPIRFVGENLGYKVSFKDNKITFSK